MNLIEVRGMIYSTENLGFSEYVCVHIYAESGSDSPYEDYNYVVVDRPSSIKTLSRQSPPSLSSSSSSAVADVEVVGQWRLGRRDGGGPKWRWCYVCSGKAPDRQCELFPQHVTLGPGKVNCTNNYCTAVFRYKPKDYIMERDRNRNEKPSIQPFS